mgnify:CR=1 FL=1
MVRAALGCGAKPVPDHDQRRLARLPLDCESIPRNAAPQLGEIQGKRSGEAGIVPALDHDKLAGECRNSFVARAGRAMLSPLRDLRGAPAASTLEGSDGRTTRSTDLHAAKRKRRS